MKLLSIFRDSLKNKNPFTFYSSNKHVEKALHKEVIKRFGLLDLRKDDSITPAYMISCCQRLLTRSEQLHAVNIHIFYSYLLKQCCYIFDVVASAFDKHCLLIRYAGSHNGWRIYIHTCMFSCFRNFMEQCFT